MLGDAAGFARHDIGVTQRIEQRRLTVIDMAHNGDDWRTGFEIFSRVFDAADIGFDIAFGHALDAVAEFGGDQFGRVGIDGLRDRRHNAQFHQAL